MITKPHATTPFISLTFDCFRSFQSWTLQTKNLSSIYSDECISQEVSLDLTVKIPYTITSADTCKDMVYHYRSVRLVRLFIFMNINYLFCYTAFFVKAKQRHQIRIGIKT